MTTATTNAPVSPQASPASVAEASPNQVRQWLSAGQAVLIDVREADEYAREHIVGAQLIPLSSFDPVRAASFAKPGQRVVMHCRSGRRSADACRLASSLAASGLPVLSMAGGIEAWKKDNLPVTLNTQVSGISVMRQVQMVIGLGVLGGSALAAFVHPWFIAVPAFFGLGLTFAGATGICALATVMGKMPWNRGAPVAPPCATGRCS